MPASALCSGLEHLARYNSWMQVWLGTSGYSYPDWVGGFYPPGTRPNRMLTHYVEHFPLVELNFTFYRLPTSAMLGRLADQAPPAFQFVVKMPRSMSHEESSHEVEGFQHATAELQGRGQLLGLLCQFPQATHHTRKHREWIETLARAFAGQPLAVEFRHRSWAAPEVAPWLNELGLELVSVDAPAIPALYPSGLVRSSPHIYVRLHSRNVQNWYLSDKDRYDYNYDDQALLEWIGAIRSQVGQVQRALVLFNNCRRSQAAENARRMRELILKVAPELEVVEPIAQPTQKTLFD